MSFVFAVVALVVEAGLFLGVLGHLYRAQARERQGWALERGNLLDRLMLLSGTPWTPAPVIPEMVRAEVEETVVDADQLVWDEA